MVIIGLAFVVVAAVFGIDLAAKNQYGVHDISVFGTSLGITGSATLFVVGAITGAVLLLGIVLLLAGVRRKGSKATARRQERKARVSELEQLRAENGDLRARLDALDGGGAGRRSDTAWTDDQSTESTSAGR